MARKKTIRKLPYGKRISRTGNVYYAYPRNNMAKRKTSTRRVVRRTRKPVDQRKSTPLTRVKNHSVKRDKKQKALHGGKRVSKNGNVYYERRENRADRNKRLKL